MAKFTPGPAVAEVRGSVGGTTFSRNRYGAYMRFRAKPTIATSEHATAAKARMTAATQAWQALTAAQRGAWNQWGRENPVVGSLGLPQAITGHAAYVGIHVRMVYTTDAPTATPPITPAPAPLTTMSVVADRTAGTCNFTYTATPTGASEIIWVRACQVASAGINYVENLMRLCCVSPMAQASPFDAIAGIQARIGDLVIGYHFYSYIHVYDRATGLLSAPLRATDTIV